MSRASSLVLIVAACGSRAKPQASAAIDHALTAAVAAADRARTPWRCAASDTPALADAKLGGWELAGHALRGGTPDLAIGVIADAGDASDATLAALGRLRGRFDEAKVGLVLALGGMGANEPELESTLGVLADHASFPVVALPGDLEPAAANEVAVAQLRKRGDSVVDGRLARWIELPGATIATIPGAGARARLVAGADGCGYTKRDVEQLLTELGGKPGLRIAASAEAPREGDAGELALATTGIEIALHGPTAPAPSPARDGGRDAKAIALSPGTSDATTRLPEPHRPSAGVLTIKGKTWSWKPLLDR
jgi:hypothetical protein